LLKSDIIVKFTPGNDLFIGSICVRITLLLADSMHFHVDQQPVIYRPLKNLANAVESHF